MCCQEQIGLIMNHKVPGNPWESMGIYGNLWEFPGISGIPKAISWSREFPPPSRDALPIVRKPTSIPYDREW